MINSGSLIVLGMPRSGTSLTANLCINAGYNPSISKDSKFFGGSPYNKSGYYEEVRFTLLNDQIIRILYGKDYSFLYPPKPIKKIKKILSNELDFTYDINESNLEIPSDYEKKIKNYTGAQNDVWGLTRMKPGEKWYKAYSKFGVSDIIGIKKYLKNYSNKISNKKGFILKDPRLCFTFNQFDFAKQKIIIVKREANQHIKSLVKHYGPKFLSSEKFKEFDWVSNHFNLKVLPIKFKTFVENYNKSIKLIKDLSNNFIEIDYESFVKLNASEISKFEDFICAKIDKKLINIK